MGSAERVKKMALFHALMLSLLYMGVSHAEVVSELGASFPAMLDIEVSHLLTHPPLSWSKDPFQKTPGLAAPLPHPTTPKYVLEAVFSDGLEREALIDGRRVRTGDELGADRFVSEIGENYVLLEDGESTLELSIPVQRSGWSEIEISSSADAKAPTLPAPSPAPVPVPVPTPARAPAKKKPEIHSAIDSNEIPQGEAQP